MLIMHLFYKLLKINWSRNVDKHPFNVRGEPIVCSPADAYECFMDTEMDVLVLDEYVLIKSEQPMGKKTNISKIANLNT